MDFKTRAYGVLIVSPHEKFNRALSEILPPSRFSPCVTVNDAASAARRLVENAFDIVIINSPLPDDFGVRLALEALSDIGTGVMIFVKNEHYHDVNEVLSPHGALVIQKPAYSQSVEQSLILLCAMCERLRQTEKKMQTLPEKMEEIRIVSRAKLILIEHLKMTEKDAHRYIEKQAMDRCVTKRRIAEMIIATYK